MKDLIFDVVIIGADSAIGTMLYKSMVSMGKKVAGTSRKKNSFYHYLDLLKSVNFDELPVGKIVFLCAGVNGYKECDENPIQSIYVNNYATVSIGSYYLSIASHVVFLSSSSVFGATNQILNETDVCSPNTFYGSLKLSTELALLSLVKNSKGVLSIARMTKVIFSNNSLLQRWNKEAEAKKDIYAFDNYSIAPVSAAYIINSLVTIANSGIGGTYHLSGSRKITYYEFSKHLRARGIISRSSNIISSIRSDDDISDQANILGMRLTTDRLGILPEDIEDVINELSYEIY